MIIDVAIIGAGPYGLAAAAHLHSNRLFVRIFGEPMASWKHNMTEDMLLKSAPWASTISDPNREFTIKRYFEDHDLPYHDRNIAVPRQIFVEYGEAYQRRYVPAVERKQVVSVVPSNGGSFVTLDDGERFYARNVIVAVGMTPFQYMPSYTHGISRDLVSHAGEYGPVDHLRGKRVLVVGAGSSAIDLAALLYDKGIDVSIVARSNQLVFGMIRERSLWQRMVAPDSGIGEGWRFMAAVNTPWLIHMLPASARLGFAYTKILGALGGPFMRDRVEGKIPVFLDREISIQHVSDSHVTVHLRNQSQRDDITADHVVFATGYQIDVNKLPFFKQETTRCIRTVESINAPALSQNYESSVAGLYFIGPAAAPSFGPVCRFVHGTGYPARRLQRHVQRSVKQLGTAQEAEI